MRSGLGLAVAFGLAAAILVSACGRPNPGAALTTASPAQTSSPSTRPSPPSLAWSPSPSPLQTPSSSSSPYPSPSICLGITPGQPLPRNDAALAYLPGLQQAVLFGGADVYGDTLGDTWTWAAGTWTQQHPVQAPAPRQNAAVAYDPVHKVVLLFDLFITNSGSGSDTWTWNGTHWSQVAKTPLVNRYAEVAAFDENTQRVLLLTMNSSGASDTWTWDGSAWQAMHPKTSPPGRSLASMAFDPMSRRVILFGGYGRTGQVLGDTWAWDGSDWTLLSPTVSPPARAGAAMTAFVSKREIVLVGGETQAPLTDAWVWNGTTWSQVASPSRRDRSSIADVGARVLLFGGTDESRAGLCSGTPQTQIWDGTIWTAA